MSTTFKVHIEHVHTYAGPNVYAREPAIVARLSVHAETLADARARIERMSAACRAWFCRPCGPDEPTALEVGRFLVCWAHHALTEVRGVLHVAKALVEDGAVLLVLGYHNPRISLAALKLASAIFSDVHRFASERIAALVSDLWRVCKRHHPDYQAAILMTAAREAGIPVLPFSQSARCWQYGWGARSKIFFESASTTNSLVGTNLAMNKAGCNDLFRSLGAPTALHVVIGSAAELEKALSLIGYPCVVKPLHGTKGAGVTAGIGNVERARIAFDFARRAASGPVMVEQFIAGDDHRLMVAAGKFIAAIKREPPAVVGDGQRTVRQLVAELNSSRSSNMVRSRYLRPIAIDKVVLECLRAQQAAADFVPAPGQRLLLRTNANLSTGGVCTDVTSRTHPLLVSMVEQLAASIGLETAGFDFVTTDISRSPWDGGGAFIEVNSVPGLDLPIAAGGSAEHVGRILFGDGIGRIPVSLFITESPRQWESLACAGAPFVAQVMGDEVRVDESVYRVNTAAPWAAVRAALRNVAVREMEIFCTPSQIVAHGLPADRLDRTVLVGVRFDERWNRVIESCSRELEIRCL